MPVGPYALCLSVPVSRFLISATLNALCGWVALFTRL